MSGRTTGILFVVLLVVAGIAYLVSRQEPAVEETATPAVAVATPVTSSLISGLSIESVSRLEVNNLQEEDSAVFEHRATDWFQTVPTQTQVMSATIDSYMQGMVILTSRRTLPSSAGEPADFGLDNPAYQIILSGRPVSETVRFTLLVGDATPADDGYYVQKQGDPRVHIVNKFVMDNLINLLESVPVLLPTPEPTPFTLVITDTVGLTGTATITATVPAITSTVPATGTLESPPPTPSN